MSKARELAVEQIRELTERHKKRAVHIPYGTPSWHRFAAVRWRLYNAECEAIYKEERA